MTKIRPLPAIADRHDKSLKNVEPGHTVGEWRDVRDTDEHYVYSIALQNEP